MKGIVVAGVVLIVLGVAGFTVGRITYPTKEKVIDLGPVEVTAEKEKAIAIPEVAAIIAFAAGIVVVIVGARKA